MLQNRIKQLRTDAGLTKAQFARLLEVSDVSAGYWESGRVQNIGSGTLLRMAQVLGITVSEILEDPVLRQHDTDVARKAVEAYKTNNENKLLSND